MSAERTAEGSALELCGRARKNTTENIVFSTSVLPQNSPLKQGFNLHYASVEQTASESET